MSHVFRNGVVKCVIVCFDSRLIMIVIRRFVVADICISVTHVEMFTRVRKACKDIGENTI